MPFNDEQLARAIAACPRPVVTGIGHEPDTSIADMVADVRASTPTGAAQEVSPSPELLSELFARRSMELANSVLNCMKSAQDRYDRLRSNPLFTDSEELLAQASLATDALATRLSAALPGCMKRNEDALIRARTQLRAMLPHMLEKHDYKARSAFESLSAQKETMLAPFQHAVSLSASRLHDLSPLAVLGRGYSMVRAQDGAIVKSVERISIDDELSVWLSDGGFHCVVTDIPMRMGMIDQNAETICDGIEEDAGAAPDEWKETLW